MNTAAVSHVSSSLQGSSQPSASLPTASPKPVDLRLAALWRFSIAISVLNILGHTVLGFEQSHLHPLVSLATAYSVELLIELGEAWAAGRRPRFLGSWKTFAEFLLPAHISGLAVAMLTYSGERLAPVMLGAAIAIGSKAFLRNVSARGARHFMNPSNLGIACVLVLFPSVGVAPGYHFVEGLTGIGDWILPGIIICTGSLLNTLFTKRIPLIAGWLLGFIAQAVVRHLLFDTSLIGSLMPMTGVAFLLFTFYMVSDPGTTPTLKGRQFLFGAAVAACYGILMAFHVVFAIFFALAIVCGIRGALIALENARVSQTSAAPAPALSPALVGSSQVR